MKKLRRSIGILTSAVLLCTGAAIVTIRAATPAPAAPAASKTVAPAPGAPPRPEESATIRDDPTIAPDPKQSADNNISFPADI